jgi:hypothetical protein
MLEDFVGSFDEWDLGGNLLTDVGILMLFAVNV